MSNSFDWLFKNQVKDHKHKFNFDSKLADERINIAKVAISVGNLIDSHHEIHITEQKTNFFIIIMKIFLYMEKKKRFALNVRSN